MFAKRQLFFVFLALIFINSSCYQDIVLDLQEPDIRPVVFGMATADKPIDVTVQKSYPLLTNTDTLDKNILTDISLFVNNELKENLQLKNKHYYSNYITRAEDKIEISFEWEGTQISAEGTVPKQVKIDSLNYLYDDSEGKNFNLFFTDDESSHNYYALSVRIKYKTDSLGIKTDFFYVTSKSPLIGNEEDFSDYYVYQSLLFTDTLFNGKAVNLVINTGKLYLYNDENLINISLYLSNISKDYYLYVKSFMKNQRAQTPDIFFDNTEYINVHSNINNGYGIFKIFTIDTKDITNYFR